MVDTTKSNDLRVVFVTMRTHKDSMQELVELLEDEQDFKYYHSDKNQYQTFCEAYTIALLEKYVRDSDVREPMLVSYQLLDDYDQIKRVRDRHMRYSERAADTNRLINKTWADPNDSLQDIEDKAIVNLVDQLIEAATNNKKRPGFLGLANIVVKQLKERFPNGLPQKLPLPKPRYKEQDVTGEQATKEKKQVGTSDPPSNPQRTNIWQFSIGSILSLNEKAHTTVNLSWDKNLILLILSAVVVIMVSAAVSFFRPQTSPENKVPPEVFTESETPPAEETSSSVEEILVSKKEIVLVPGETCPLKYRVLPEEAGNAPLSFVSSDPDTVTVSHTGVLTAYDSSQIKSRPYQKVDITIQAESGVTETKTVVVNFAGIDQAKINEEVEAGFYVWPQVRLVGSKDWSDSVDAKVGDKVEFWIQYRNISSENQENVMIRDVLPQSLRYINGTTKLWNDHLNGAVIDRDTIATTGINIGHYGPNANAHIRFQAEVVEDGLVKGYNTLGNWAQISAADVLMQDYVSVIVNKS